MRQSIGNGKNQHQSEFFQVISKKVRLQEKRNVHKLTFLLTKKGQFEADFCGILVMNLILVHSSQ
jgi:hypothetical protein